MASPDLLDLQPEHCRMVAVVHLHLDIHHTLAEHGLTGWCSKPPMLACCC